MKLHFFHAIHEGIDHGPYFGSFNKTPATAQRRQDIAAILKSLRETNILSNLCVNPHSLISTRLLSQKL